MKETNLRIKRCFILQSFAPLFLLLTIKHLDVCSYWDLIHRFFDAIKKNGFITLLKAINHPALGGMFVSALGIFWILLTVFIAFGFKGMQTSGFKAAGEYIVIGEVQSEESATFLVTYILPLLTDDLGSLRGLIVFLLILAMIIFLLINSKVFYYNPILTALKYEVFTFKFQNPDSDIESAEKEYIGITRGNKISAGATIKIKRKHISDDVFLIYKD